MRRGIRKQLPAALALVAMAALALVVASYILTQQGLRLPYVTEEPLRIKAELVPAQGVAPGQNQAVTVAGVKVGKIGGVDLVEGRARVELEIDPEHRGLIREDATALLRPRTPLKDMFLEIDPGRPPAPEAREGYVIPVSNTAADINQDEILASLDTDTRDYLRHLINGAGIALEGRGDELSDIFFRFEPTHRDLARLGDAVSARDAELRDLVTALAQLNGELARQPRALTRLVDSSAAVFDALASRSPELRRSVRELPETLTVSRRALDSTGRFARTLRPAATELLPAIDSLDRANAQLRPLARLATPLVRERIRPFVREARPLVRELRPQAERLADSTPELTRVTGVVNRFLNTFGYDPRAGKGPYDGTGAAGYPFFYAWGAHNSMSVFGTQDANNLYRSVVVGLSCDAARETAGGNPQAEFLFNLTPLLTSRLTCGEGSG